MQLDDLLIAEGCYQSSEYHRALMYLEQYMTKTKKGLSEPTEADLLTVSDSICLNYFERQFLNVIFFFFFRKFTYH